MRNSTTFIFLFLCFFNLHCQKRTNDTLEIEEAIFRRLFSIKKSSLKTDSCFITVSDSGNYTLGRIIQQLKDIRPSVKDVKELNILKSDEYEKIEFIIFDISQIVFKDDNKKALVSCGYYKGSLNAAGNIATLIKRRGKWKLIKMENLWVS